jgi:hypothetical protein
MQAPADVEQTAASMNICHHGVYFSTDQRVPKGVMIQVHLKMPREVVGDDVREWCFTGRVAHVESVEPRMINWAWAYSSSTMKFHELRSSGAPDNPMPDSHVHIH